MPKQPAKPALSEIGEKALADYEHHLRSDVDLRPTTIRNYLSDIRLFISWYEQTTPQEKEEPVSFLPTQITTPTLTRYRDYLKHPLDCKPATINRYLVSLKRYFGWALERGAIQRNPAKVVKLVNRSPKSPRHLTDKEEEKLLAAAQHHVRDYTLLLFMLHTGFRVGEVCALKREDLVLEKRTGYARVWGKRNKYREVPLNITARNTLSEYFASDKAGKQFLFESQRTHQALTPRAVGFLIAKYAQKASIPALTPHDLRHRFGYRMAQKVPLHQLAQIMGHNSLDTTLIYIQATAHDLQRAVEEISWQ